MSYEPVPQYDIQYSEKSEKEKAWRNGSASNDLITTLKSPTSLIIMVLMCVLIAMTMQFGALQNQISKLQREVNSFQKIKHRVEDKVYGLKKEMKLLEQDEWDNEKKTERLEKKEKFLEKTEKKHDDEIRKIEKEQKKSTGKGTKDKDVIHTKQLPLIPHKNKKASHFPNFKHFMGNVFNAKSEKKDSKKDNKKNDKKKAAVGGTSNKNHTKPEHKDDNKAAKNATTPVESKNQTSAAETNSSSYIPSLSSFFSKVTKPGPVAEEKSDKKE